MVWEIKQVKLFMDFWEIPPDLLEYFEPVEQGNMTDVWNIATSPFPAAHFATFSPEIPRKCISAGTSEKGCCPKCGAPWKRVVEKKKRPDHIERGQSYITEISGERGGWKSLNGEGAIYSKKYCNDTTTTGWTPTCKCYGRLDEWREYIKVNKIDPDEQAVPTGWDTSVSEGGHGKIHKEGRRSKQKVITKELVAEQEAENESIRALRQELMAYWAPLPVTPCTVLDPFSGASTTALVAAKLGRDAIGIELNPEYVEMSRKRLTKELGMLAEIEVVKL